MAFTGSPQAHGGFDVLLPAPAILHIAKGSRTSTPPQIFRLRPLPSAVQLPGWTPPQTGLRPLWLFARERTERLSGYLTLAGITRFLDGGLAMPGDIVPPESLYGFDQRTGIRVAAERSTADEGFIYAASLLALRPGVCFYAELCWPPDVPSPDLEGLMHWGGEGRSVQLSECEPVAWPGCAPRPGQGTLVLLTTSASFHDRWRPQCLAPGDPLVGAAVPGYEPVSGWDLARGGPKPSRFAVSAGSVYFLRGVRDDLPARSLADSAEDRRLGWGTYLRGVWHDD